jgi:hypothetical protein
MIFVFSGYDSDRTNGAGTSSNAAMKPRHKLIEFNELWDVRGRLAFAQEGDQIPFSVRRIFMLYNMAAGASRGGHAHRGQHQLLMMMAGAASVRIDDGVMTDQLRLDRPSCGLHVPPMLWLGLEDFTPDAVCAVLASGVFEESDYIRDYREFKRLADVQS